MSAKSPHVEIYRSEEGWRWRHRAANGVKIARSARTYNYPRDLVSGLELAHPGYHLRDNAQGLTGYGGWSLWPLHNTAETPPIPVRVPAGTVKRWGSRRQR